MFDFDVRDVPPEPETELLSHLAVPGFRDELQTPISMIPRRPSLTVAPSCTLREVTGAMREQRTGTALVASEGVVLGVLLQPHILAKLMTPPALAPDSPAWMAMTNHQESLLEDASAGFALHRMRLANARSLPMVGRSGAVRGLLDLHDLIAWLCDRIAARATLSPSSALPYKLGTDSP
jgi:CBS domain-containing protein